MTVFVTPKGYVPKAVSSPTLINYPGAYEMKMDRALTMAGMVRDEAGQPVPEVQVNLHAYDISYETGPDRIAFHAKDSAATTDRFGRWSLSHVPKSFPTASVHLTHPDYMVTSATVPMGSAERTNALLVIKRGTTIKGMVADTNENPIGNASVSEVHNYGYRVTSAATGVDGAFVLNGLRPGKIELVVQADGFAPGHRVITTSNTMEEAAFRLDAGHTVRGRVVDESGKPIMGAVARTDSDNQGQRKVQWSAKTDVNGRFEWHSAPADALLYSFEAPGFSSRRVAPLAPGETEHEIKLRPAQLESAMMPLRGKVVDAESGQPIPVFRVWHGEVSPPAEFPTRAAGNGIGRNGRFELRFAYPPFSSHYKVVVEAEGYAPAASARLAASQEVPELEFKLQRGGQFRGVVIGPDEQPVPNATVVLCSTRSSVYIDRPAEVRKNATRLPSSTTDHNGVFSFPPQVDADTVVVVHELGYSQVPVEQLGASPVISLMPWGSVEGTLMIGDKPAASQTVLLHNPPYRSVQGMRSFPVLSLWLDSQTDEHGKFRIDKVPPGERRVSHRIKTAPGTTGSMRLNQGTVIQVEPGETTHVVLGGKGRPVVGRVVVTGYSRPIDWSRNVIKLTLQQTNTGAPVPPSRNTYPTPEALAEARKEFQEVYRTFWSSEAGRAVERVRREHTVGFNADGSFRIDDVLPGNYELKTELTEALEGSLGPARGPGEGPAIGTLTQVIDVPEMTDRLDEPLDLGTLKIASHKE